MYSSKIITGITIIVLLNVLLLPLRCFAAVQTEQNWDIEDDSQLRHLFKPSRRVLNSWDDDYGNRHNKYKSDSFDDGKKIYAIVCGILVLIGLLIKCCIKCAQTADEEETNAVVHPPPSSVAAMPVLSSSSGRVSHLPPHSDVTVIIPTSFSNPGRAYAGIENPGFNPSMNSSSIDGFIVPAVDDMPPAYDTVVASDLRNVSEQAVRLPNVVANSFPSAPPKYVEKWGDDRKIYYFTTRRPFPWNRYTISPQRPREDDTSSGFSGIGSSAAWIFAIIFVFVGLFFLLLRCIMNSSNNSDSSSTDGATVHSPPRSRTFETPRIQTAAATSSFNSSFPTVFHPENTEFTINVSLLDSAFDSRRNENTDRAAGTDKPPDYAAVVLGDFSKDIPHPKFPDVAPSKTDETPPPKYDEFYLPPSNEH